MASVICRKTHVSATSARLGLNATCTNQTALGVTGCQTAGERRATEGLARVSTETYHIRGT